MLIAFSPIFADIISQLLERLCEKAKLYYPKTRDKEKDS